MIRVKVCGMHEPLNVKEIAEAKPHFIGFIFYSGSKRYVGDYPDPELFRNVPAGIKKTGVFYNENIESILDKSASTGLDAIQLHGTESPESCYKLKSSGLIVIKTFHIGPDFSFGSLKPYIGGCDFFLFDTKSEIPGGSGKKFDWERLAGYSEDKPFFLSGGIEPGDSSVIKLLRNKGLYAVDINSRFEISTGVKDVLKVKEFIKEIKEDSYEL